MALPRAWAALLFIALCGSAFAVLDWGPKLQALTALERELAEAMPGLAQDRQALRHLPDLTRRMEAREREEQDLLTGLGIPEDPCLWTGSPPMVPLETTVRACGLRILSFTPGGVPEPREVVESPAHSQRLLRGSPAATIS